MSFRYPPVTPAHWSSFRKTMAACKTRHIRSLLFLYQPQSLTLSATHASTVARAQLFSTNACQLVKSVQSSRNRREAIASQPSLKVISREAMKEELPMDFGLLPMFIMPSGDRLPSLVYSTKDRLQLEWSRLKARFNDLRGWVVIYIQPVFRKILLTGLLPDVLPTNIILAGNPDRNFTGVACHRRPKIYIRLCTAPSSIEISQD